MAILRLYLGMINKPLSTRKKALRNLDDLDKLLYREYIAEMEFRGGTRGRLGKETALC